MSCEAPPSNLDLHRTAVHFGLGMGEGNGTGVKFV